MCSVINVHTQTDATEFASNTHRIKLSIADMTRGRCSGECFMSVQPTHSVHLLNSICTHKIASKIWYAHNLYAMLTLHTQFVCI